MDPTKRKPRILLATWALPLLVGALASCQKEGTFEPYAVRAVEQSLELGGMTVTAEAAFDRQSRSRGLDDRTTMPDDHAMVLIYPDDRVVRLGFGETFFDVSVAFVHEDGTIANIADGTARRDMPGAVSKGPVRYAVLMNRGWFGNHGVEAGQMLTLPDWVYEVDAQ